MCGRKCVINAAGQGKITRILIRRQQCNYLLQHGDELKVLDECPTLLEQSYSFKRTTPGVTPVSKEEEETEATVYMVSQKLGNRRLENIDLV